MKKKPYLCTPDAQMLERLDRLDYLEFKSAPVAELVDAPDLGSGVHNVQVRVLSGALLTAKTRNMTKKT